MMTSQLIKIESFVYTVYYPIFDEVTLTKLKIVALSIIQSTSNFQGLHNNRV